MGKKAVIDCAPMRKYELPKTVRAMAVTHGITLDDAAAQHLIELVGENTVHLDAELKKLALSHTAGGRPPGVAEVDAMVSRTAEVKPWEFVDAFAARDMRLCIDLLSKMDSASPYALVGMCATRLRELVTAHSLASRGQSGTKALATQLKVPEWRVKNHMGWARRWKPSELRHAFSSVRECERMMKTGSDPDETFLRWLLDTLRA